MTKGFEFISDGDKIRLRVSGETLEELFASSLRGLAFYLKPEIVDLKKSDLKEWHAIKAEAVDTLSLLVEFLEKAIEHTDMHGAVFLAVSFDSFEESFLEGKIFGTKIEDSEKEVRGVSFDEMSIERNAETGLYETTLVFEV